MVQGQHYETLMAILNSFELVGSLIGLRKWLHMSKLHQSGTILFANFRLAWKTFQRQVVFCHNNSDVVKAL